MGLSWTPQFAEGMGGASRPDIVVSLPSGKQALIDITSDRYHILGKAGGWTTSERYVYVAEAYFEPFKATHLPIIDKAVTAGGMTSEEVWKLRLEANEKRAQQYAEFREGQAKVRSDFRDAGSFAAYARAHFGGNTTAASRFLQEWGIRVKGASVRKGGRKMSPEAKAKQMKQARKKKYQETKKRRRAEEVEKKRRAGEATTATAPVDAEIEDVSGDAEDEIMGFEDEASENSEVEGVTDDAKEETRVLDADAH